MPCVCMGRIVCAHCLNSQFPVNQYSCFLNVSEEDYYRYRWLQRCLLCNRIHYSISVTLKNTEALIDTSKEVDLEVNTEKTKYMLMSCHQNVGQNYNIKIANKIL
jgi:hypothetical protein